MTPLYRASAALYRAAECNRIGPVAEWAADSIGGNVGDVDRLLFEVDREGSRERHAKEDAA